MLNKNIQIKICKMQDSNKTFNRSHGEESMHGENENIIANLNESDLYKNIDT